jgi:D-mannonate dehydratase
MNEPYLDAAGLPPRTCQGDIRRRAVEKIDVIIPTYNRSQFFHLRAAIGRDLNQSFGDLTPRRGSMMPVEDDTHLL